MVITSKCPDHDMTDNSPDCHDFLLKRLKDMMYLIKYIMPLPKNRNPVSSLFITFPKWEEDKRAYLLDQFENMYPTNYARICQELHSDGSPHYHLAVKLKTPVSYRQVLNSYKDLYPEDNKRIDVQPLKNWKQSLAYLAKEDSEFIETGVRPVVEFQSRSEKRWRRRYDEAMRKWAEVLESEGFKTDAEYREYHDVFCIMTPYERMEHYPITQYQWYWDKYTGIRGYQYTDLEVSSYARHKKFYKNFDDKLYVNLKE